MGSAFSASNPLCSTPGIPYDTRGSGFLLPFSTIVSTIVEFQAASGSGSYPPPIAAFSLFFYCFCKFSSILADQRFQLVCCLLPHVTVAVAVNIQSESDGRVAQCFRERLGIYMALQG